MPSLCLGVGNAVAMVVEQVYSVPGPAMPGSWVWEENLRPFLEVVAGYAGYEFDPDDWNALRYGVADSDEENGRWYDYEFPGPPRISLKLARVPGSCVVAVQAESDVATEGRIETVLRIAQHYHLTPRN